MNDVFRDSTAHRATKRWAMLALALGLAMGSAAAAAEGGGGGHGGGGGGGHAGAGGRGGGGHVGGGFARGGYGGNGGYGHGGYGYRGGHGFQGGYGGRGFGGGLGYGGWGPLGFGLFFATLPFYYSTLWWDDVPYYYANDNYYQWDVAAGEYETVRAPPNAVSQAPGAQPSDAGSAGMPPGVATSDIFAYPKNGQNTADQAKDKYECHRWAVSESGFDPTSPGASSASGSAMQQEGYRRAQIACLQGRGYSVK